MNQLQGKTEYAQAKDLLRLMEQNAVTAHELVELVPMRESFIINFYNITKREMENDALCHRQSLKGIVKMVLILRDAAYDANVSPKERIHIIDALTELSDMIADADIKHAEHTYKMRKAAGVLSILTVVGAIFCYKRGY